MKSDGVLYLLGRDAVCPICSGMVKQSSNPDLYKCNDCGHVYKMCGLGDADKEIKIECVNM